MGMDTPEFNKTFFERWYDMSSDTIGWIATAWMVAFPIILKPDPLHTDSDLSRYKELLKHNEGSDAVDRAGLTYWNAASVT